MKNYFQKTQRKQQQLFPETASLIIHKPHCEQSSLKLLPTEVTTMKSVSIMFCGLFRVRLRSDQYCIKAHAVYIVIFEILNIVTTIKDNNKLLRLLM